MNSMIPQPLTMAVGWDVAHTKTAISNEAVEVERKDMMAPISPQINLYPLWLVFVCFYLQTLYVAVSLQSISKL